MIITSLKQTNKDFDRIIDLTGERGNAFCILGMADSICNQLGYSTEKRRSITGEMTSSNYKN
jgi:hypothetical protein